MLEKNTDTHGRSVLGKNDVVPMQMPRRSRTTIKGHAHADHRHMSTAFATTDKTQLLLSCVMSDRSLICWERGRTPRPASKVVACASNPH